MTILKFNSFISENIDERIPKMEKIFTKTKIDSKLRNKINKEIHILLKPTYFETIPLENIFKILNDNGIVALQEDNTEWEGFLVGAEGRATIELADNMIYKKINDIKVYTPFENCYLIITWYKMEFNKYEVIGYLS